MRKLERRRGTGEMGCAEARIRGWRCQRTDMATDEKTGEKVEDRDNEMRRAKYKRETMSRTNGATDEKAGEKAEDPGNGTR